MWQSVGQKKKPSSPLLELEMCSREKGENIFKHGGFLERECATSLQDSRLSDCRISSGQEAKWFYAARATREHLFRGVSTNSVR